MRDFRPVRPLSDGMKFERLRRFLPAVLLLLLPACATVTRSADGEPVPISQSVHPYWMAPLDSAQVSLPDGKRLSVQITNDGTIALKDQTRQVEGLPVDDFRALLRKAYGANARVEVTEFRPNRVTVLGEVFHQIHTQLDDGPMRVMDAIAAANGFTSLANRRRVKLVRQNAGVVEVYELDLREMMYGRDLGQNMLLKPGDVITIPRNFL
jgi:protein involved in polysaccharide export with SLBB domain